MVVLALAQPARAGQPPASRDEAPPVADDAIEPVPIRAPAPRPTSGALHVESTAHGARLVAESLDDDTGGPSTVELGPLPVHASLPAGRWRLRTESAGYQPWSLDVTIVAGEPLTLEVEPELIEDAWLELRAANEASEGAEVSLDGELLCGLPCRERVEPGKHRVAVRKRRHKPLDFPLRMNQADEVTLDVRLQPSTSRAPAVLTGALGLTTLVAGVTFTTLGVQAQRSLAADLDGFGQYDRDDPRFENGRRDLNVGIAMWGATAGLTALTLYYLLHQPGEASRADKRRRNLAVQLDGVAPLVSPLGSGLGVGLGARLRF
ncbi:hypothetical protein PPSIR1_15435 [Plesiocystis pacifica SIR-1]|uniref:PEGA domain-containing protein n=2 Tax=Plesiocystis pacifica TaxID=191768 RepID=A6GK54_9BACT|nr:hypothetical protein PPSIR1_15435 [Plesiocystis pacifica SIR-1]